MGTSQSVRATDFQRPSNAEVDPMEEMPEDHHISISNKMVERLVEDATIAGGAAISNPAAPRGDYKDKLFVERLKCMDETHSERTGLTAEDLNAIATRIDLRTANMVSVEPVCSESKQRVIDCYNNYQLPEDNIKCWETVGAFTACVQETGARRLHARTVREAREHARRERHVALAREHELRDLALSRDDAIPAS